MKTVSAREAKNEFGSLVDAAQREPVILTKHNRPVAAVVSIEDLAQIPKYRRQVRAIGAGKESVDITRYIGAAKGLFSSPAEADAFIRRERDLWD